MARDIRPGDLFRVDGVGGTRLPPDESARLYRVEGEEPVYVSQHDVFLAVYAGHRDDRIVTVDVARGILFNFVYNCTRV